MQFFRQALLLTGLVASAFALSVKSSGLEKRVINRNDPNLVVVHIKDPSSPEVQVFCYTTKQHFGEQLNKFPASRWTGHQEPSPGGFKGQIFTFTSTQPDCFSDADIEYFRLAFGECERASAMCLPP